jgi:hypothetical protein
MEREMTRRVVRSGIIAAGLAVCAAVAPRSALGAASTAACVPLEQVPFGPPSGTHHVSGTGVETGTLGFYAFIPPDGVFAAGRPVDMTLEVRNGGNAPAAFSFPTSQRYDAVVWDDDCHEVWRWSAGRMFAQVVGTVTVPPHRRTVYQIVWPQRDQAGHQVRTGGYEVRVIFLGRGPLRFGAGRSAAAYVRRPAALAANAR